MTPTDPFWVLFSYALLFGIYITFAVVGAWHVSGWMYDKWYYYKSLRIHKRFICVNRPCVFGCK